MPEESEAINILCTDGAVNYSLRVAVTPAQKAKVEKRDAADPFVEGTAINLGSGLTQTTVPVKVKTHIRYASVGEVSPEFVRDLIYNGYYGGVYNFIKETGVRTWQGMEYLPVPVLEKSPREVMAPEAKKLTPKVICSSARGSVKPIG